VVSLAKVVLTAQAEADLARLDKMVANQVLKRLRWLTENFDLIVPQPLTGQWRDHYKLRAGDYRVIYRIEGQEPEIVVELIRHRREVYK
jgi:mRNA interferase RelE/StbE